MKFNKKLELAVAVATVLYIMFSIHSMLVG